MLISYLDRGLPNTVVRVKGITVKEKEGVSSRSSLVDKLITL